MWLVIWFIGVVSVLLLVGVLAALKDLGIIK